MYKECHLIFGILKTNLTNSVICALIVKKKKKYHDWEAIHKEIQNEDFQRWCTCYKLLISQRRIKKHKSIDIKDVTFLQPIINIKFLKII